MFLVELNLYEKVFLKTQITQCGFFRTIRPNE